MFAQVTAKNARSVFETHCIYIFAVLIKFDNSVTYIIYMDGL